MIKKIITTTTLIAAAAAMANAAGLTVGESVLISFSTNGPGTNQGTFLDGYKGAESTYNWLRSQTANGGYTWENLANSAGTATDIALTTDKGNLGVPGLISAGINGDTTGLYSVFDESAIKGSTLDTANNSRGGAAQTGNVTFAGLVEGQRYKIEVFAGRGNATNGGVGTYGIVGGTNVVANLNASNGPASDLGSTISATTTGDSKTAINWALMTFEFTANSTTAAGLSCDGYGNVGAIALTAIPEPSMFGLLAGLGALALVGARRRRK